MTRHSLRVTVSVYGSGHFYNFLMATLVYVWLNIYYKSMLILIYSWILHRTQRVASNRFILFLCHYNSQSVFGYQALANLDLSDVLYLTPCQRIEAEKVMLTGNQYIYKIQIDNWKLSVFRNFISWFVSSLLIKKWLLIVNSTDI